MSIRRSLVPSVLSACAIMLLVAHNVVTAQPATGSVTGRVMWGPCIRAIPLPMAPDAQGAPTTPDSQIQPMPVPPQNGLPAGAVLVAVQNTSVNARTDEAGRFTLSGVPAGQYLTIAAGPVANASAATAVRPNVFVDGGQSVDLGTLNLGGGGGSGVFGFPCRVLPGVGQAAPGSEVTPQEVPPTEPAPSEPAP